MEVFSNKISGDGYCARVGPRQNQNSRAFGANYVFFD